MDDGGDFPHIEYVPTTGGGGGGGEVLSALMRLYEMYSQHKEQKKTDASYAALGIPGVTDEASYRVYQEQHGTFADQQRAKEEADTVAERGKTHAEFAQTRADALAEKEREWNEMLAQKAAAARQQTYQENTAAGQRMTAQEAADQEKTDALKAKTSKDQLDALRSYYENLASKRDPNTGHFPDDVYDKTGKYVGPGKTEKTADAVMDRIAQMTGLDPTQFVPKDAAPATATSGREGADTFGGGTTAPTTPPQEGGPVTKLGYSLGEGNPSSILSALEHPVDNAKKGLAALTADTPGSMLWNAHTLVDPKTDQELPTPRTGIQWNDGTTTFGTSNVPAGPAPEPVVQAAQQTAQPAPAATTTPAATQPAPAQAAPPEASIGSGTDQLQPRLGAVLHGLPLDQVQQIVSHPNFPLLNQAVTQNPQILDKVKSITAPPAGQAPAPYKDILQMAPGEYAAQRTGGQ